MSPSSARVKYPPSLAKPTKLFHYSYKVEDYGIEFCWELLSHFVPAPERDVRTKSWSGHAASVSAA